MSSTTNTPDFTPAPQIAAPQPEAATPPAKKPVGKRGLIIGGAVGAALIGAVALSVTQPWLGGDAYAYKVTTNDEMSSVNYNTTDGTPISTRTGRYWEKILRVSENAPVNVYINLSDSEDKTLRAKCEVWQDSRLITSAMSTPTEYSNGYGVTCNAGFGGHVKPLD